MPMDSRLAFKPPFKPLPENKPNENLPKIKIHKQIPKTISNRALELAIELFVTESNVKGDPIGFKNQTIESIANATFLNGGGDFWLAEDNGKVAIYLLARVTKDIDNSLTYWVNQAWVHPNWRGHRVVKDWWEEIRKQAKRYFCKHLVIVSSRNPKAYSRFLGHGLEEYATLMMENLD